MALVNVYDKLAMDTNPTGQEGTVQKTLYKHLGELNNESKAKVIILYRTVPDEPKSCLVVGTKFLPEMHHNDLMKAVESDGGQKEFELASYLMRQTFSDGTNMLTSLHEANHIKKFDTKEITVTYGTSDAGRIRLDKLNDEIAKDRGVKVSELAIKDESGATTPAKKSDAKKTTKK